MFLRASFCRLNVFMFCSFFALNLHAQNNSDQDNQALQQEAASFYQQQDWKKAAGAYEKIVEQVPQNYAAWYRLAIALIEIKQGIRALDALEVAGKSPQIPPSLIHYQRARVHKLTGNKKLMFQQLNSAADAGYASLSNLTENAFWDVVRQNKEFSDVVHKVDRTARPCAYDKKHAEFDFWLGHWDVYGNKERTGPLFGKNHIEKQQNHCLMMENWNGSGGSIGTSMNYYDGTLGKWVQHWVSGGTVINIEGGLTKGSMLLVGKIFYMNTQTNPIRDFRGTWTPIEKNLVRQFFEESIDGGKTWTPWFEGFYFKTSD